MPKLLTHLSVFSVFFFTLFLFSGCDRSSNNKIDPIEEQEVILLAGALYDEDPLPSSQTLITFSLFEKSQHQFDLYKLGIIDIVLEIDTGSEVLRHSLTGKLIPEDFYLDDANAIDLTTLKDAYQFYGFFDVPVGKLKAIEIAFSGSKSEIIHKGNRYSLVDSHFALYPNYLAKNPDKLNEQRFPLIVRHPIKDPITFEEGDLSPINIEIQAFESFTKEALESVDNNTTYGFFSPMFAVIPLPHKGDFPAPIPLRIKESNDILFTGSDQPAMILGELSTQIFTTEYKISKNARLHIDGQATDNLSNTKGSAAIDLTGTLTINKAGYFYELDQANIHFFDQSLQKILYEGRVSSRSSTKVEISGKKLDLSNKEMAFLEGEAFQGNVSLPSNNISKGDFISVFQSDDGTRILPPQKLRGDQTEVFDIHSSLAIEADDILNLENNTDKNDILSLSNPLPCETFIEYCQSDQPIKTLDFSNAQGTHRVIILGLGEYQENNNNPFFIKSKTLIKTYKDSQTLLSALKKQTTAGYRIYRLSGEGKQIDDRFTFSSDLNLIALSPDLKQEASSKILKGPIMIENLQDKFSIAINKIKKLRFGISGKNLVNRTKKSFQGLKTINILSKTGGIRKKFSTSKNIKNLQTNSALTLSTAIAETPQKNKVIIQPMNQILAEATANASTDKIARYNVIRADDINVEVKEVVSNISSHIPPKIYDIVQALPNTNQLKPIPSRISTLANTLTESLILSKTEALRLASINPRLKTMSPQEFNATLAFRQNHGKLAALLTVAGLFPTEESANDRIAKALGEITPDAMQKGDIESKVKVITQEVDLSLTKQKTNIANIGNPKGIPSPPPLPPGIKALKNNLIDTANAGQKSVTTLKSQPIDLANEIKNVQLKKTTPAGTINIDPHSALMAEILSGKAKLKSASKDLTKSKEASLQSNKSGIGELILNKVNSLNLTNPEPSINNSEAFNGASDDEWADEERSYSVEQEKLKSTADAIENTKAKSNLAIDDIQSKVTNDLQKQTSLKPKTGTPSITPDIQNSLNQQIIKRRKGISGK